MRIHIPKVDNFSYLGERRYLAGSQVESTHLCNFTIPGLPIVLTGHIVPGLSITSLIGIRVLCKEGCNVVFTMNYCNVIYNNRVVFRGTKDSFTKLRTLPLNVSEDMLHMEKKVGEPHTNPPTSGKPQIAAFTVDASKE